MKTLYIDCAMGAAGDMLTAALSELLEDKEEFIAEFNSLNIPGVSLDIVPSVKCGITGSHATVLVNGTEEESHDHHHEHHHDHEHEHHHEHDHEHEHGEHEHHHSSMHDIEHIVNDHLNISEKVKKDVLAVYRIIAEAESTVHGVPVTDIHFHEVGTMDAVADVTAVCMLMEKLAPEKVVVSPVHVGSGQVKCAHGILPVPAPATALILKDVPIYGGQIKGELCTPTGAALLKYFSDSFGEMPVMTVTKIGYGMGKKDFEAANCVRAILGNTQITRETICELCCNTDDMTGEALGFVMERLMEAGALDVYTTPIGMKKSRPGILLSVMCKEQDREKIISLIFTHTTTLGIRENISRRYTMTRRIETIDTPLGAVRVKKSEGFGVKREKIEYEDLAKLAIENNTSIEAVKKMIK